MTKRVQTIGEKAPVEPSEDKPEVPAGPSIASACGFTFHIVAEGDVNIHAACSSHDERDPAEEPDAPFGCGSVGTCVPVVAGAKHKRSRDQKLRARADRDPIASAIATSIFHALRRFVLGKVAANALEERSFAIFRKMPAHLLACIVSAFECLPPALSDTLVVSGLVPDTDQAIELDLLTQALATELQQRAGAVLFDDPTAAEEQRPGLVRLFVPVGEDFTSQVRICRVNNLRTASYIPLLSDGEYLPQEMQQDCLPVISGGEVQTVCEVRTGDCTGNPLAGVCGRVLDVAQGDGVQLQGVNFFSLDAKVRLIDRETQTIVRDVDAYVWGDKLTPLEETIDGAVRLVRDCRVEDKLTFRVPADLLPGIYMVQAMMPNPTGNPVFGDFLFSNTEFIHVMLPPDASFQIVMERIRARRETAPDWPRCSDEVGLHTISCALDLSKRPMRTSVHKFPSLEGVEFDNGTQRDLTDVIFQTDQPILALVINVLGYEIDSRGAYDRQITDWTDYFLELVKEQWDFAVEHLDAEDIAKLISLGWTGAIIAAIGLALVAAIDVVISMWAPADLIIEDNITLSILDLERLTNANAPGPPATTHTTNGDIVVNVSTTIPPEKIPLQYRETREYVCDAEESHYELTYRYNRLS